MNIDTLTGAGPAPATCNLAVTLDQDVADKLRDLTYITGRTKRALVSAAILAASEVTPNV